MSAPTTQQQAAIAARGNVLVAAGAGTGKTSTVTDRCVDLVLRERCPIDQILMVTFTEAAAAEMRERLRKKLRAADSAKPGADSNPWLTEQIALLDTASISTLHSFCLELVLRNFHILGIDPQLVVLDESQTKPLIHAVLDQLFLKHYASEVAESSCVRELIRTYGRGDDAAIRNLIVQIHRHAQTLANPAGWFTSQTALFQNQQPDAWREQLTTAAREWAELWLDALAESTGESSAFALSHQALTQLLAGPLTFANVQATLQCVIVADESEWNYGTKTKVRKPFERFFDAARFLHDLATNNGEALAEDWQWSRERMLTLLRLAQEFESAFSEAKHQLGGIDFADQEQFALRLLINPDGSPSPIAQACRDRFQFVFVDECQDINAAQDAIIRAISQEGKTANRFLVGDVKQSIYRFRLADPRIFQSYEENWKSQGSTRQSGSVLPLTENFRSAQGLLLFINPVFRSLMRPVIGGLNYDTATELQFGAPQARKALAADNDSAPRVALHLVTKGEDPGTAEDIESNGDLPGIPDLPTTEREARLIATQLRKLKESRYQVWDRESGEGGFRPVEYSDMVVLLRGVAGRAEMFAKAFHQIGVPLLAARTGFLTAIEVTDVLNLLRLLDNPLQDLPLLAVLRSPFVGLSANELAQIRIVERRGLIWTALMNVVRLKSKLSAELVGRISAFIDQYHRWRDLIRHSSLTHCIETALIETCYESLLLADDRGAERVANVRRLVEMARRFDPFQREGLYRFLQFIDEQEAAEVEHEPAAAPSTNAVRLMTIHASKGLEFPVVVLASIGTRFNLRDLSSDVLVDDELGLCPKIFPPSTRTKYPSIAHWLAAQRERRALLGEELRLLYVAMTRARDQLLLVGTATKQDEAERWQTPAAITNQALLKAGSYLDWLRLWFTSQPSLPSWTTASEGSSTLLSWKFWSLSGASLISESRDGSTHPELRLPPTAEQLSHIRRVLSSPYEHEGAIVKPAKTTVTAIRRRLADEIDDEARRLFQDRIPASATRKLSPKLSAAEIGTAHHTFLQFVALKRTGTELDLRNEAAQLERSGALSPEQLEVLDFAALTEFWQSDLGKELRGLPESIVNREMPFTARFQASEIEGLLRPDLMSKEINLKADADFVVVQGIADVAVLLPKEIWLLDFKTDHVSPDELAEKVRLYAPQLKIYALALARIFHRPVTRCCVHFLTTRETKMIEPAACI